MEPAAAQTAVQFLTLNWTQINVLLGGLIVGIAVLIWFLLKSSNKREEACEKRNAETTAKLVGVLQGECQKSTAAIDKNTEGYNRLCDLIDRRLPVLALFLLLPLVGCSQKRDQLIADLAASSFEAAEAIEQGVPPAKPAAAIKAASAAIIHATDREYAPAAAHLKALDAPKE